MFEKYSESFLNNFDLLLEKFPDKKFITFKKDEILFTENSKVNEIYFILSGELILTKKNETGEYEKVKISLSGDILGFNDAITNSNHSVTAVTVKDTNTFSISKIDLIKVINKKDDFNLWALKYLSKRISSHD